VAFICIESETKRNNLKTNNTMKTLKVIAIATMIFGAGTLGFSQDNNVKSKEKTNLMGPKAKNTKPWENKSHGAIVVTKDKAKQGPSAKNYKPWEDKGEITGQIVLKKEDKLTGPKAKNYKPWDSNNVNSNNLADKK